jgi:hypothetical protein
MPLRFNSKSWILPLAILLGLNSAYLALRSDPNPFYFANVALHLGLGLALMVTAGPLVRRVFRTLAPPEKLAALLLGGAAALGLVMMVTGTTRPFRPILWAHIALAASAALILVARAAAGAFAAWLPKGALVRELAILGLAAAALTPALRYHADFLAPNGQRIVNPALPPLSMEGEGAGPQSPFFPSSANTDSGKTIPATFFMTSQTCAKCHKDIYDQWNSSAHHSLRSTTSGTGSRSSTCRTSSAPSPASGARAAMTTRSSSTAASTGRSRSRSRRPRRRTASAATRATRSCTCAARWARATSRSSTRRCTTSR